MSDEELPDVLPEYVGRVMNKTVDWLQRADTTDLDLFAEQYGDFPIAKVAANDGVLRKVYNERAFFLQYSCEGLPLRQSVPLVDVTSEAEISEELKQSMDRHPSQNLTAGIEARFTQAGKALRDGLTFPGPTTTYISLHTQRERAARESLGDTVTVHWSDGSSEEFHHVLRTEYDIEILKIFFDLDPAVDGDTRPVYIPLNSNVRYYETGV